MEKQSESTSWIRTGLTTRLGIEYPIIQGPLGGLSSQRLTAAVSNFGGLGSFGAHSLRPDAIRKVIPDFTPQVPGQQPTGVLPWATDPDLTEQLWHLSKEMTGVKFSG